MSHYFISYSRQNLEFVAKLKDDLTKAQIETWIDQVGLKPGTYDWEKALRDAIKQSRGVVLVASPSSQESPFVRDEIAIARAANRKIYPVWADGAEWTDSIPMGMGYVQFVDMRGEAYQYGLSQLVTALGGSQSEITTATFKPMLPSEPALNIDFEPRNPYKGLRAFGAEDRRDFFGRDALIDELLNRLQNNADTSRFLAVVGASGSGKSSAIMAGLLPVLQDGALHDSDTWRYLEPMVPGNAPIENLMLKLSNIFPRKSHSAIMDDLANPNSRGLHNLARQATNQSHVVLYIDQFEELFTLTSSEDERRHFIDIITTAATEPNGKLILIVSIRADFYDRPLEYNTLGNLIKANTATVLPMTLADLYDVIEKPASLDDVRITFEDGLISEILFAVRDEIGALPLLQFTLDQLFQRRDGHVLTWQAYEDIGGVRGALTRHAEQTYLELPSQNHKQMARSLFLRLIEPGITEQDTTRRRAEFHELTLADASETAILQETAEEFVENRLLIRDEDTIEVAHEALIREWERLSVWLNEARSELRLQKKITTDAVDWVNAGKHPDDARLYRGELLREGLEWAAKNTASKNESEFLNASLTLENQREEEDQKRRAREQEIAERASTFEVRARQFRRAAAVLGIVVFVAVAAILLAITQVSNTQNEVATAVQEINSAEQQITLANATIQEADRQIEGVQPTVDAADTQVANVQPTLDHANALVQFADTQVAGIQPTVDAADTQVANIEPTIQQANTLLRVAETQVAGVQPTLIQADALVLDAQTQVAGIQPTVDAADTQVANVQPTLDQANDLVFAARTQVAGVQPTVDAADTQVAKVEPTLQQANALVQLAETQVAGVQPTLEKSDELVIAAQTQVAEVQPTVDAADTQVANVQPTLQEANALVFAANTQVAGVQPTVDAADTQVANVQPTLQEADALVFAARTQVAAVQPTVDAADTQVANVQPTLQQADALVLDAQTQVAGVQPTIDTANTQVAGVQPTLDQANELVYAANTQVAGVQPTVDAADTQVAKVEPTLQQADALVLDAQTQVAAVQPTVDAANTQVANVQPTVDAADTQVANVQPTLEQANELVFAANTQVAGVQPTVDAADTQVANIEPTLQQADALVLDAQTQVAGVQPTIDTANTQVAGVQPTIDTANTQVAGVQPTVDAADTQVAGVQPTLQRAETQVAAVNPTFTAVAQSIELQTNIATSLSMIRSAQQLLASGDPDTAIALIIEAYRLNSTLSEPRLLLNDAIPLTVRLVINKTGHVQFDPTGQYLMVTDGGTVELWDVRARQVAYVITADSSINVAVFSPDGKNLALGTRSGVETWNIIENRLIYATRSGAVRAIDYHPEQEIVASGDARGTVTIWDASGKPIMQETNFEGPIIKVAFQGNGGTVYAFSRLDEVTKSGTIQLDQGYTNYNRGVTTYRGFSPDGRFGYTGANGTNQFLTLWSANTFAQYREFIRGDRTADYISEIDFSQDGKYVLVHSENRDYNDKRSMYWIRGRHMALWDISTSEETVRFEAPELDPNNWDIDSLALSPDGTMALTGGRVGPLNVVILWDVASGEIIRQFTGHTNTIPEVGFHPESLYAYSRSNDGTTRIWDILSLQSNSLDRFDITERELGIAGLSDDTQELYVAFNNQSISRWQVDTNEEIPGVRFVTGTQNVVAFNPVTPIAFVATTESAELWDLTTRTYLHRFDLRSPGRITLARFSQDGTRLLIGDNRSMNIYNSETFELIQTVSGNSSTANINGEYLTYSNGSSIVVYDLFQQTQICQFSDTAGPVTDVAFSPAADKVLASIGEPGNKLILIDARFCRQQFEMLGHTDAINSVAFSPDGFLAVSGGDDGKLILWDVLTGLPLQTFEGHTTPIRQVLFGKDGNTAISVSGDINDGILKWNIRSTQATIEWVQQNRYIVELSCAQREQYNIRPKCVQGQLPEVPTVTPFPTLTPIPTSTLRPTPTVTNTPIPVGTICGSGGAKVRIRTGAGDGYKIMDTVDSGTSVVIVEELPNIGWAEIILPNNRHGFVILGALKYGTGC